MSDDQIREINNRLENIESLLAMLVAASNCEDLHISNRHPCQEFNDELAEVRKRTMEKRASR